MLIISTTDIFSFFLHDLNKLAFQCNVQKQIRLSGEFRFIQGEFLVRQAEGAYLS